MSVSSRLFPVEVLSAVLRATGFRGEMEADRALLAAMSTDNSVYQIMPDFVVSPADAKDMALLAHILARPEFSHLPVTARGGGTGTNGQSLNRGLIIDTRRNMNRVLSVDTTMGWADVEPGVGLDDLNEQLRSTGWFFAPETSTSNRCTIGGMVSTDASGKGSRVYGKTSDNIVALEIARPEGLISSDAEPPDWAKPLLETAEKAARQGRAAFIANTPVLNRRFTGYDLERACPENGKFEWWRLFPGSEGTLGLITRIRVKLRRIETEKRLMVVAFDSFSNALAAAAPLLRAHPTAVEIMDERVQALAESAGVLAHLPKSLQGYAGQRIAYLFIEFNGNDPGALEANVTSAREILAALSGSGAIHVADDPEQIRSLWAIRSAGVGLLGRVKGAARPVAFVEDCVVPPENLPAFVEEFLELLAHYELEFGIYGHVDVGCLHIRPALNIDVIEDRQTLVAISDAVFALTRKYNGIFWGEHGKGVRGAYLEEWLGPDAYSAMRQIKATFDPQNRFNPGKLVSPTGDLMGIADTPFRPFNAADSDPLGRAFRCNGNAQCLSYAKSTPMCPSFKATGDLRQSPKGRADALREWHRGRADGKTDPALETDLMQTLDNCLGCRACASSCPVQVDIPHMRSIFYSDYYSRNKRLLADRLTLIAERHSPLLTDMSRLIAPVWPLLVRLGEKLTATIDLPRALAGKAEKGLRLSRRELASGELPDRTVILVQDWFTELFDQDLRRDMVDGLRSLGYIPRLLAMKPAGKAAHSLGEFQSFENMARALTSHLRAAASTGFPIVGMDPAFVMMLRQDYPVAGFNLPQVLLAQEFLARELNRGLSFPMAKQANPVRLLSHCTEITAVANSAALWAQVFTALGVQAEFPKTGCCGMAGLFGHQERHQPVSRKLFDLSWNEQTESEKPVVVTGFSCRCQVARYTNTTPRHPLGIISEILGRN